MLWPGRSFAVDLVLCDQSIHLSFDIFVLKATLVQSKKLIWELAADFLCSL